MSDQTTSITAAATASSDTPTLEASLRQRRLALSLISTCHTLNHLQYSITSVIFPVMMKELGFGLLQLGALSAFSNFVGQGLQVIYGLITGFFKRSVILGTGNVIVGVSAISQFFVGNYSQLLVARVAIDAGLSPQHPLGASILARFFPKARGWALTFHHSAGSFGSFQAWRPSRCFTWVGKRPLSFSAFRVWSWGSRFSWCANMLPRPTKPETARAPSRRTSTPTVPA